MASRGKTFIPEGMTDVEYILFQQRQAAEQNTIDTRPRIATPKKDRVRQIVRGVKSKAQIRNGRRLVIERGPSAVRNDAGEVVGVSVYVRLFEGRVEVPIDRHRIFINPPIQLIKNGKRVRKPIETFWSILWESVETNPASEGWRP